MNSFSILRTNVGLTTNVKVMVSSDYKIYLESIDSDPQLSSSKYKKFQLNKSSYYDEAVSNFFSGLPVDISYKIKYDNDNDNMFNTFDKQFDDIYQMGCRNIIDNKNYSEEFECFAPLYIGDGSFPKYFGVFRVDGPGLINLNKDNFKSEILNNLKCVTIFDLTKNTPLGEWIEKSFTRNQYFPVTPFYMDFRSLEFSSWNGIDYETGGYTTKSFFLDSTLEYENTFYDLEKTIFDGYKNNKVIFPNILNFSFLFDDTPATPNSLRKWSINRYMGFYFEELENLYNVSPYVLYPLRSDVTIQGNVLVSQSDENPFLNDWSTVSNSPYIEIDGVYYKVERYSRTYSPNFNKVKLSSTAYSDEFTQTEKYFYKVISDIDFTGRTTNNINSKSVVITNATQSSYSSIELINGNLIPDYDTADLWIININNKYHVINKKDGVYYIQSDYSFTMNTDSLVYYINSPDPNYRTSLSLNIDGSSSLVQFKIYRCKFTDIKDFDTSIVDTDFSKFEYQKNNQLTNTDEVKMYTKDYDSPNNPKDYNDYIINGQVSNIPCSSEYTSNGETFRIIDNDLSPLWRKNPVRLKWGYQNSLSSNDYPYLLNNSFLAEDFNKSTNIFDPIPNRRERNLDYFYSVNSSTASYIYHSLHVEEVSSDSIDDTFNFDLFSYLDSSTTSYDYFINFFGKKSILDSGNFIYNTEKYSLFEKGDNIIPNTTLFRGLKYSLFDVADVKISDNIIDNINLIPSNKYQGYKFSVLLSKNNYRVVPSKSDSSVGVLTQSSSSLSWYIINKWEHNKTYIYGDIISYYDILYIALTQSNISDPSKNPATETNLWGYYTPTFSKFWSPNASYNINDFVYNNGEYYYYKGGSNTDADFWKPFDGTSYIKEKRVIYNGKIWESIYDGSNFTQPESTSVWRDNIEDQSINQAYPFWKEVDFSNSKWGIIEIWSPIYIYTSNSITKSNETISTPGSPYCVYKDILYKLNTSYSSGEEPGVSNSWTRMYSIVPDTDYKYTNTDNAIISLNNRYYQVTSPNIDGSTLENGICIYINKIYKNVLINIYINDNTLPNISNADRDLLYNDLYANLTAANINTAIGDMSNKCGFSDYLQYVIINEDGTLNTYNYLNIEKLPCILSFQQPDQLFCRLQSFDIKTSTLESSQFKAKRVLDNGNTNTVDMLNYYNNNSLATVIEKRKDDPEIIPNFHGLTNNIYNTIYRYSGYYCPIFYKIPLFKSSFTQKEIEAVSGSSLLIFGNYKFDTDLTNFGTMKERILSKINRKSNILKLRFNPDIKSIYPMIDEFGYTFSDYFIFKSTWDYEYFIECLDVEQVQVVDLLSNKILKT